MRNTNDLPVDRQPADTPQAALYLAQLNEARRIAHERTIALNMANQYLSITNSGFLNLMAAFAKLRVTNTNNYRFNLYNDRF